MTTNITHTTSSFVGHPGLKRRVMCHRRLWGVVWVTPLLLLLGCATSSGLGDYVNMDSGTCAEFGSAAALLAGASPMGMLAATAITAGLCHVITPKNELTGYISMPVQSQRLSMGVVQPLPPLPEPTRP